MLAATREFLRLDSEQNRYTDRYNRYSTALLIGEKAAMLVAEDLGYSGEALDMKVPTYHAPGEMNLAFRV
jgi:hypothetical protein